MTSAKIRLLTGAIKKRSYDTLFAIFLKAIRLFLMSFEFQKKMIQFCYLGHYI